MIFTCAVTPYRLAFTEKDEIEWVIINYSVDIMFLIDMILNFNSAFYDEDFKMKQNRGLIAITYIKGWFFIDLVAIFPIGLIQKLSSGSNSGDSGSDDAGRANAIARIARIGRMYKLVKLTRLVRILKIFKSKGSMFKNAKKKMNISEGFEKLVFFCMMSCLICHIVACMWVFST